MAAMVAEAEAETEANCAKKPTAIISSESLVDGAEAAAKSIENTTHTEHKMFSSPVAAYQVGTPETPLSNETILSNQQLAGQSPTYVSSQTSSSSPSAKRKTLAFNAQVANSDGTTNSTSPIQQQQKTPVPSFAPTATQGFCCSTIKNNNTNIKNENQIPTTTTSTPAAEPAAAAADGDNKKLSGFDAVVNALKQAGILRSVTIANVCDCKSCNDSTNTANNKDSQDGEQPSSKSDNANTTTTATQEESSGDENQDNTNIAEMLQALIDKFSNALLWPSPTSLVKILGLSEPQKQDENAFYVSGSSTVTWASFSRAITSKQLISVLQKICTVPVDDNTMLRDAKGTFYGMHDIYALHSARFLRIYSPVEEE